MKGVVTIRLDEELERRLDQVCTRSGMSRSSVVREALRRHLTLAQFQQLREQVMPFAAAQGYLVDEDVLREVS